MEASIGTGSAIFLIYSIDSKFVSRQETFLRNKHTAHNADVTYRKAEINFRAIMPCTFKRLTLYLIFKGF